MKADFIVLLEANKAIDNIKGFDNALRCIKMKWDAVVNKTFGIFPEKLWNFFFATVISKLRDELCPREMKQRKDISEAKRKEWENRKNWEQEAFDSFWERVWSKNVILHVTSIPLEEFQLLDIKNIENITEQEIKSAYRELSKIHHPDKGGKQDIFVNLTNAKNKCLTYLNNL